MTEHQDKLTGVWKEIFDIRQGLMDAQNLTAAVIEKLDMMEIAPPESDYETIIRVLRKSENLVGLWDKKEYKLGDKEITLYSLENTILHFDREGNIQ